MTQEEFMANLTAAAQVVCDAYGVPWQVCVAQGAIESSYGKDAIGDFNIFGRKYNGEGKKVTVATQEEVDGVLIDTVADFQDYDSLEDAIEDWCILMTQEPLYMDCLNYTDNPNAFADCIANTYATDSNYASLIKKVMRDWGLV